MFNHIPTCRARMKNLLATISIVLLLFILPIPQLLAQSSRYKVAVVDLMILKRQKLGAFQLTRDIGADGVEVDMGGLGNRPTFDNQLLNDTTRKQFLDKAKELGLEIPSLAMTGYYAQSFCERKEFIRSIEDCIKTMKLMDVKIAFLPMGVQCDLVKKPELRDSVVSRLKIAGALAEQAGVVIGIETALDARDEKKLLKDIGSPAIKSYFNFSNALKNGRDVSKELKTLGRVSIAIFCIVYPFIFLTEVVMGALPGLAGILLSLSVERMHVFNSCFLFSQPSLSLYNVDR